MQTLDFRTFLSTLHPFDMLDERTMARVVDSIDILYFQPGETILDVGKNSDYYYIIAKGAVDEYGGEELITRYFEKDSFDAPAAPQNSLP